MLLSTDGCCCCLAWLDDHDTLLILVWLCSSGFSVVLLQVLVVFIWHISCYCCRCWLCSSGLSVVVIVAVVGCVRGVTDVACWGGTAASFKASYRKESIHLSGHVRPFAGRNPSVGVENVQSHFLPLLPHHISLQ